MYTHTNTCIYINLNRNKISSNPIYSTLFFFLNPKLDQAWMLAIAMNNFSKGLALLRSYSGNNNAWIQRLVYMVCCLLAWTIDHLCESFLGNGLNSNMWWFHTSNNEKKFLFSPRIKGLIKATQLRLDCVASSWGRGDIFKDVFPFT